MISRDKAFPPARYSVPRPKVVRVIEVPGMTTSQISPAVFAAVDRTHTKARSPRGQPPPSRPVTRSPRPTPTVRPTVGELLRGGSSAVRLRRSLETLVGIYESECDGDTLKRLRLGFETRAVTAPTTTGGMVNLDDFEAVVQGVFSEMGEPVDRRLISRMFHILDAAESGMVDYKLLLLAFAKLLPLNLPAKVTLIHQLYGDDKEQPLEWAAEQELELVEYAKSLLSQMEGSKHPSMLTVNEISAAGRRSPLIQHALNCCFGFVPSTAKLLTVLRKQGVAASASAAALMLAQMGQGEKDAPLEWSALKALWGVLHARIERTGGRCTLPRADFIDEVTRLQGGTETADRRLTLEKVFAIADPDGSGIVDARDCCAVLCRGVRHERLSAAANVEARLKFFRSMYEVPIGAAGPNGPAIALDKTHYIKIIERALDEIRESAIIVRTTSSGLRVDTGRLDVDSIVSALSKNADFFAALSIIL